VRAFARTCGRLIAVSEERELLGTAGGLTRAAPLLGPGEVLVWNADIIANVDLRTLVASHASRDSEATLVIQPAPPAHGPVGVDEQGRVVRLRQERFGDEVSGGEFLGISLLGASLRERLPERGCLVGDGFLPALRAGRTLRAFGHHAPWYDVGTVATYLAANLAWLDVRGLERWAGEGARVAPGVRLDRAVVGRGAQVVGSGPITRCVLWPDARATAPLAGAVVTPHGVARAPG